MRWPASSTSTKRQVIARLARLRECGAVSRVGGTCRPNTAGASTLAAVAAPDDRIEAVAALIGAEPGVNHSYLRENDWNIWFVATGPDRAHVDATLARIGRKAGLKVLDLRLVRPFNVDLGFGLDGPAPVPAPREAHPEVLEAGDRAILQGLSEGLDLVPNGPMPRSAKRIGRDEDAVLRRIGVLLEAGLIGRLGVIVRHRALGWTANAMVVWEAPDDDDRGCGGAAGGAAGRDALLPAPAGGTGLALHALLHDPRPLARGGAGNTRARRGGGRAGRVAARDPVFAALLQTEGRARRPWQQGDAA